MRTERLGTMSGGRLETGSRTAMPRGLRLAVAAIVIAIVLSALALWADRGSALLLDLAAMGARLLCL